MRKGIIFDFDGVIAESVQVKSDAFAEIYSPFGNDVVQKVLSHHEANGGMSRFEKIKYYHETILKQSTTEAEITKLSNQFSELVVEKVIAAPYVPGALEYIQKSYEQFKLFISTGTPTEEMRKIIKARNIAHFFTDIFGSPEKKTKHLKMILSEYNMSRDELLFYGDSNSDQDAAENTNISFVLIKNSFNQKLAEVYKGKIIKNFIGLL